MTSPYLRSRTGKRVCVLWLLEWKESLTNVIMTSMDLFNILYRAEDNLYTLCSHSVNWSFIRLVNQSIALSLTNVFPSSIPPLCQRHTWFPQWWRRPQVFTPSRAPCTCSPQRQTRTLCFSALWSTACQEMISNRRSPTASPSTSTVSGEEGREQSTGGGWTAGAVFSDFVNEDLQPVVL